MDKVRQWAEKLPGGIPEAWSAGRRVVVTGCAGFIGSTLTEALLELGVHVTGVDSLNDYYDPAEKHEHLAPFKQHEAFEFIHADLNDLDAVQLLAGSTACFHFAAQAGVRASWGSYFDEYVARNIQATQRLLEACRDESVKSSLKRFVYSSSSSVYGDQTDLPVTEKALPAPRSPYGVTKMAAEHLCVLYSSNFGVPTSSLRYFTVYGPRQRPDMAFRIFIEKALDGETFKVFGDGGQTRDFTFVDDAARANLLAVLPESTSAVFNVGGGQRVSLHDALAELQEILAREVPGLDPKIEYEDVALGDVRDTFADRTFIESTVGYRPLVPFSEGLLREVRWAVERRSHLG